jgi:hypothetical protein
MNLLHFDMKRLLYFVLTWLIMSCKQDGSFEYTSSRVINRKADSIKVDTKRSKWIYSCHHIRKFKRWLIFARLSYQTHTNICLPGNFMPILKLIHHNLHWLYEWYCCRYRYVSSDTLDWFWSSGWRKWLCFTNIITFINSNTTY